ncbi:glycosyltransferase [bacterium]|nr:glycosyltransferase [candidate division CSSED10-310 bacterium]
MIKVVFVGISGFDYPHTRVRCYNFAEQLSKYPDVETRVISFKDHLGPQFSEVEMWGLRERDRIKLNMKGLISLLRYPRSVFYIQKIHYHAAAPLLLSKYWFNRYIFDYDDYDVDLTVPFKTSFLNRSVFGSDNSQTMTQHIAKGALGCVASSKALEDYLRQFNSNVAYISTGVDIGKFQFVDRRHRKTTTFLWNGLVWGEEIFKSVVMLLNSFKTVAEKGLDVRLKLVGGGQYMSNVVEHINNEFGDLASQIDLDGWVSPEKMPSVLAESDVGLLPLAGDSLWLKSKSPTKLFEYMATGLPVVASDVGEVHNVIEHQKSGCLATGAQEFTEYMYKMAEDKALRLSIGQQARDRVERQYSLPVLVERLYYYIKKVIKDAYRSH